jgi:uncharacterized protein (TIGR02231 family)
MMSTLTAPIQRVTVYSNRARITREGAIYLDVGEHTITLEDLPMALEDKTVRAASTDSDLRIIDVEVAAEALPSPDSAEIETLQTRYDELHDANEALIDNDRVLANRLNALRDMYNAASEELGASLARGDLPLDNINVILNYMSEQEETINRQRRDIARQRRDIAEQIKALQANLPAGATLKTRPSSHIEPEAVQDDEPEEEDDDEVAAKLLRRRRPSRDDRRDDDTNKRRNPFELPPLPKKRPTLDRFSDKRKTITLTVYADQPGEYHFQISYNVSQASWQPFYDVRVAEDQFAVTFLAEICQNTHEDWPPVPITLSTARPLQDADMPKIRPWLIDAERPTPTRRSFGRRSNNNDDNSNSRGFGGSRRPPANNRRAPFGGRNDDKDTDDAPNPQSVKFDEEPAHISGVTPTVTYDVQQALAISGDNTAHKAFVETFALEGELDLIAIPEQAETAFLCAHIRNTTGQVLLGGNALIFFGTQYIGKTQLKAINPNHKFMVQLGEQERIRVERKLDKHTSTNLASNDAKSRTEFIYRIRVFNDGDDHVNVTVYDHIPVARNKEIVVHLRAMSPTPTSRHNHNIFDWQLSIAPGKHEEITMGFALDHPHDMKIVSKRS